MGKGEVDCIVGEKGVLNAQAFCYDQAPSDILRQILFHIYGTIPRVTMIYIGRMQK